MATIGILTGGGDCAGLNAVIAGIVKAGLPLGHTFIGFDKGWEGVLDPVMYRPLTAESVRGISHIGGTILHTTNKGRFGAKVGAGGVARIPDEILDMAARNLQSLGVTALIVLGGDGTLTGALQLSERAGIQLVGVPKTIDNDLMSTDQTFGFSTAVQVAVEAMDKIHTTATSHQRTILVECMGRHAGWIALFAGLAGNANAILLPEFPFALEDLVAHLKHRQDDGLPSIVCVAEGITVPGISRSGENLGASEHSLAGVAHQLQHAIEQYAPETFELRTVVLGHTQRGGSPNAEDRILAKRYGVAALEAVHAGESGVMVSLRDSNLTLVKIADAVSGLKLVTATTPELQTSKQMGIFIN
jgi:6-phosphofructokinase 1